MSDSPSVLPTPPSVRSFGFFFFALLAVMGAYATYKNWSFSVVLLTSFCSFFFLLATLLAPKVLEPLNVAWFKLGLLLGKIVSPLVLGAIFFLLLTPCAVIGRMIGRDELRLKKRDTSSFWVTRSPPGPEMDSFKNQF